MWFVLIYLPMNNRKFSNINAYLVPKLLLWHIGFKVTTTFLPSCNLVVAPLFLSAGVSSFHWLEFYIFMISTELCFSTFVILPFMFRKITKSLPICSWGFRSFLLSSWHLPIIKDVRKYLPIMHAYQLKKANQVVGIIWS